MSKHWADDELVQLAAECVYDPLTWVMGNYPWGEPGTFLEHEPGPDDWQIEVLNEIGEEMRRVDRGETYMNTAQFSVGSGHGTGKTALESWIIQWFLSTRESPAGTATAGTETQLRTKLWRELAKWHSVSSNKHWFDWTATAFRLVEDPVKWGINAIPWSEHNAAAFAGLHEGNVLGIFEEASTIPRIIYETMEGAFTTPGGLWLLVGNRTDATGYFNDCFGRNKKYWRNFTVDARTARKADKKRIQQWKENYGEDSDFFRVRVLGLPPKGGGERRITVDMIEAALAREMLEDWLHDETPLVMGIDPAGGGVSKTSIVLRRGPLVKREWIHRFSESNQMRVASLIGAYVSKYKPDYAFIDAHGIGKPICDRLHQLGYRSVTPVYASDRSAVVEKLRYFNPRAEWWGRMADWLKVGSMPDDQELRDELLAQPMEERQGRLQLMSKVEMRETGLQSPDTADALSLTFAELVSTRRDALPLGKDGPLPENT